MTWRQPVETWFPCLQPNIQEMIQSCSAAYTVPGYTLAGNVYDILALLYVDGEGSEQELLFRQVYQVVKNTFPLPPPLDRTYYFTPAYWTPMTDYLAAAPDIDISQCPIIAFKGNKGGGWP